ncbi:MAG: IcmG protein [uncultured bacterium]|nr:MAG: IcmG protein [uncultured bacterium]
MDDKTTISPETAEYQFTDSDNIAENVVGQQPADSGSLEEIPASGFSIKNINWRRLVPPVVVILAILLVYGFISFSGAKKTRQAAQKTIAAQEASNMQQTSIQTPAPIIAQPSPSLSGDQIEQIQATVQQKISELGQLVSDDRDQVSKLREAIVKTQQDISDINQNVSQMMVAMQQALDDIQRLKTPKTKPQKKPYKPVAIYHVRAIVPGRVWLESTDGKSVTLRVGDSLEGYGKVEVISPRQGLVIMSNGSYIQYGVNDC